MYAAHVDVSDLAQTRALLKRLEPDLLKRLDQQLNAVARDLRSGAQSRFAQTGADGDAYVVRSRNRVSGFSKSVAARGGSVGAGEKWSTEPGVLAAIFEFANGVRNAQPQNVARTQSLIATLNARYGSPGRFLWSAWDAKSSTYMADVEAAIAAVEAEYSARLGAA